jgi:6-phosphogluconolactonase
MLLALSSLTSVAPVPFYIGTYTSPEGSRGIYRSTFDAATGAMTPPTLVAETPNPSYLAWHPGGQILYAVNETREGTVSAFASDSGGELRFLNRESVHGADPCHLSLHPKGTHLFAANYSSGNAVALPVEADGRLRPASGIFQNEGTGPNEGRQKGPHMHFVAPVGDGSTLHACDLGTDEVLTLRLDAASGELKAGSPRAAKTEPGGGPRHLALSADGRHAYVNTEMKNGLEHFRRNPESGELTRVGTTPTVPEGARSSSAAILMHPSGRWLFVSNRGHDSIAVFAIGEDGAPSLKSIVPAVAQPRGVALDPSGRWLLVASQAKGEIGAMAFDPASGSLELKPERIRVDRPVCLLFPAVSR